MTEQEKPDRPIQYRVIEDVYGRCGRTVRTLPAGFYDVANMGMGEYGLSAKLPVVDELIDISGTVADEIFDDIERFIGTVDDYKAFGLTHKRGYLFYGPPGSGKTSLGMMLARRFISRTGGVVIYVSDEDELVEGVSIMRDVEPGRPSMYLIEEADRVVNDTRCLSILDGELSIHGSVFVAMTNYKKKLPPRISNRPGRFDRVVYVGCPPEAVQVEYLRRVANRSPERMSQSSSVEEIVRSLSGLPVSMAHLREAFISHDLMGLPLVDLRTRFEVMCGLPSPDDDENGDDELDAIEVSDS